MHLCMHRDETRLVIDWRQLSAQHEQRAHAIYHSPKLRAVYHSPQLRAVAITDSNRTLPWCCLRRALGAQQARHDRLVNGSVCVLDDRLSHAFVVVICERDLIINRSIYFMHRDPYDREKQQTEKQKCVSKTDTNSPFAFQIAFSRGTDFAGFLQGGSKSRDLQSEISVRIESWIESADSRLQLQC